MTTSHTNTTNSAGRPDILPISADNGLVWLASQYHAAVKAGDAFRDAADNADGDMIAHRLRTTGNHHLDRAERLAAAICDIQADGLPGALEQVRALLDLEQMADGARYDRACSTALVSIGRVLSGVVGGEAALAPPGGDPFASDPAAVVGVWEANKAA